MIPVPTMVVKLVHGLRQLVLKMTMVMDGQTISTDTQLTSITEEDKVFAICADSI